MRKGFGGPGIIGVLVLILIVLAISIFVVNKGSSLLFAGTDSAVSCESATAGIYSMCAHQSYSCPGTINTELKSGCGLKSENMKNGFGTNAASYTKCCVVNVCGDVVDPGNVPRETLILTNPNDKKLCIGEAAKCNSGNNCCCKRGDGQKAAEDAIRKQIDDKFP